MTAEIPDQLATRDYIILSSATGPQISFFGDSLTAGCDGSHPPDYYITMPTWNGQIITKNSAGIGGRTLLNMADNVCNSLSPFFATYSGLNIVVLWGGINDIGSGATAQETYSRLVALSKHLKAQGWIVFVCTLTSAKGFEAQREAFNAIVYANWWTFADNLIDLAGNANIGADGAWANGTYFQTTGSAIGIHLTDAGYTMVGVIEQTAIGGYLTSMANAHTASSSVPISGPVTLTTTSCINVTSISLPTAGRWRVRGNVISSMAATTTMICFAGWISPLSALFPSVPNGGAYAAWNGSVVGVAQNLSLPVGEIDVVATSPMTLYLTVYSSFSGGANSAYGYIGATRI